PALDGLLPEEVAELLRRVGMPERHAEHALDDDRIDRPASLLELFLDVDAKERRRDDVEHHPLRAPPEGLVLVREDPLQHVALASEVDVRDVGLGLEDGAHEPRELPVDVDDLLKLVEDERHLPPPLRAELAGKLEQALERRVD